jgi:exodeoxyribonuclease V beta subunit
MTTLDPMALPLTGNCLIEAGAGTGKTYTIASIFLRLVLSGRPVRDILVVTFTEAATAELKDRLRKRLREAFEAFKSGNGGDDPFIGRLLVETVPEEHPRTARRLMLALSGFDEAAVFTIHSFCLRVLKENAFESGVMFDAELSRDPDPVYRDIAADYWALETYDLAGAWVRYLSGKNAVTPDTLAGIIKRISGQTDRQVLPEPEDVSGEVALFGDLYKEARQCWALERGEIEDIFANHSGVNRKSYNKRYLPKWMAALDDYFRGEEPETLHGGDTLEKFSQSRISEKAATLKGAPAPPMHRFFELCEQIIGLGPKWRIQFQRRFVDFGLKALGERKADMGLRFFNDLIQDLDRALSGRDGERLVRRIRNRFPVALIDEFQDTDLAQYRIFRTIYQHGETPFFMIGDPKQSIYAFRGADVFAYLQAVRDAGESVHTLTVNWRSDPSLIRAVNTIFDTRRAPQPFGIAEIGFLPAGERPGATDGFAVSGKSAAPMEFLMVRRGEMTGGEAGSGDQINKGWADENLPDMTAADICRLLETGCLIKEDVSRPVVPGDIAVLVRTNRQGQLIQAALRSKGIPTVLASQDSVFESDEAGELGRILRAVAAPPTDMAMYTAMATDFLGVSGNRIDALRGGDPEWEWWVDRFKEWHRIWQEKGFVQMMTRLFFERGPGRARSFLADLLSLADGERRVTNFQHLLELLQTAARREHLGPAGLLRWFERQRTGRGEDSEANELRLESDARALRIVTVHKSKGLEYPVVYLPFLWDASRIGDNAPPAQCHLPDKESLPVFDIGSDAIKENLVLAEREQRAEDLRLLYVALTRARHACRVVWGGFKGIENSALAYLLHRPEALADAPDFFAISDHVKGLADDDLISGLQQVADSAGGAIGFRELMPDPEAAYVPEMLAPKILACRKATRIARRRWRMESFSHLVAEASHETTPEDEIGRDHDQLIAGGDTVTEAFTTGDLGGAKRIVPLAGFSRGADAGIFFHAIYEHLDFTVSDSVGIEKVVSDTLSDYGFTAQQWEGIVSKGITDTLNCPLDPDVPGLSLRNVSMAQRLNELAFIFPAARKSQERETPATAERIAGIFKTDASPVIPEDYFRRVATLRFSAIRGFLKGFMDLVFEYKGKWYLVDYKSNHLGEGYEDYGPENLARVMADHHYFLQYHIYLVALHRYLAYRIPDYNYEEHFGGVYYLFIRGMSPEREGGGVFRDRPTLEMVALLDRMFG